MCLGVPGRVVKVDRIDGLLFGRVDFGGVCRQVCLEHAPDAAPGDYVLVHVGFALARISAEEAERVLAMLTGSDELGALEEPPE